MQRFLEEQKDLNSSALRQVAEEEKLGRISGSIGWRKQRGETGQPSMQKLNCKFHFFFFFYLLIPISNKKKTYQ